MLSGTLWLRVLLLGWSGWIGATASAYYNNDRWLLTATDDLTGPAGGAITLTWGLADDGTTVPNVLPGVNRNSNLIERLDDWFGAGDGGTDYTSRPWFSYLQSSFDRWGDTSGVTFVYEPADDGATHGSSTGILGRRADIRLAGGRYDGTVGSNRGTLAFSIAPDNADIFLDTDDVAYYSNPADDAFSLRHTLMHEIGHSLGLGHLTSTNAAILMEPFPQTSFDGPQLDDIRGVQFLYGDALEAAGGNNTLATATPLGSLSIGQTLGIGLDGSAGQAVSPGMSDYVSIHRSNDEDVYLVEVAEPSYVAVELLGVGPTYNQRIQTSSTTENIQSSAVGQLALAIRRDGVLIDDSYRGSELRFVASEPGTYAIHVTAQTDATQLYQLTLSASEATLAGDYTGDGFVDAADYTLWRDRLNSANLLAADGNGNGLVDAADYSVWASTYGSLPPPSSAPSVGVPEPSGGLLLVAGFMICCGFLKTDRLCAA